MKTLLLSPLLAIALATTLFAEDPKNSTTPSFLEPGREYLFTFAKDSSPPDFKGQATIIVTVLSAPSNGWVHIEYQTVTLTPEGLPSNEKPKRQQVWLNLAQVVTIREAQSKPAKESARRAAINAFLSTNVPWKDEFELRSSDGEEYWFFMFVATKRGPDRDVTVLVYKKDGKIEFMVGA